MLLRLTTKSRSRNSINNIPSNDRVTASNVRRSGGGVAAVTIGLAGMDERRECD